MSSSVFQLPMVRTASITAVVSAAGAVAGLALDALLLYWFGAGVQTDALLAALVIPALLNGIVSIQAPKVLVPVFSALFDSDEEKAWSILRNLLTTSGLMFAGVAAVGAAIAPFVIPLQVPGLSSNAIALTISLSRVLFFLVLLQGLGFILQAVLYARQLYFVSSTPKLIINLTTIAIAFAVGPQRMSVEVAALGMLAGSIAQLAILWGTLAALGFRYRWSLNFAEPTLRNIFRSFRYPIAGHVLGESGAIVQSVLASFLGSGSLTLLQYASRILGAIGGILLGSVVQVTLPMIAKHAATRDVNLQRRTLLDAFQLLTLAAVPLSIWLVFLAEPAVRLLFERGQFSAADTATTAAIIRVMVPYFLLARVVSVSQTLFYANADLRTPFISTVIFAIANVIVAVALAPWLREPGVGIALSVAAVCNTVYMVVKLNRTFGPVGWSMMWPFGIRVAGSAALAAGGFAIGLGISSALVVSAPLSRLVTVALPTALGFAIFGLGIAVTDFGARRFILSLTNRFLT